MKHFQKSNIRETLRGHVIVPMISPVTSNLEPDLQASCRVANHILSGGCQGILLGGTNGEGPSFTARQRIAQLHAVAQHVCGRGLVYAGISSTSFAEAVEIGRESLRAGAVAVVAHPPPCFIVNAIEIEAYYLRLIDAVGGPFFIYNMPITTRISIPLDVIDSLSRHPLVLGIKDSEGDADRQEQLAAAHKTRADFAVFCGAMAHSAQSLAAGAVGNVPSAGNLDPAACRKLVDFTFAGSPDLQTAAQRVMAVAQIYQQGGRQLPAQISVLKSCASLLGLCGRETLPPLLTTTEAELPGLREKLAAIGLLK